MSILEYDRRQRRIRTEDGRHIAVTEDDVDDIDRLMRVRDWAIEQGLMGEGDYLMPSEAA